jgi:hypothetical protein
VIQTYRGIGVQVSTHVLDFKLQLMLRPVASTLNRLSAISTCHPSLPAYLEGKMFQEVSCAICLIRLGPRSSINPNADRRRLRPGGMFCSNLRYISIISEQLIWFWALRSSHWIVLLIPSSRHSSPPESQILFLAELQRSDQHGRVVPG